MSPEILARLTPNSLDPSRIRYSGGIAEHSAGEIAGALAHCSQGAQWYAAVYYMQQYECRWLLWDELTRIVTDIWERRGWETRKPELLQGLAWLAIVEEEPVNTRCPVCNGIGNKVVQGRVIDCNPCGGSGKRDLRNRAGIVGCDRKHWDRDLRGKYEAVVAPIMPMWNSEVWWALIKGLTTPHYEGQNSQHGTVTPDES